MTTQRLRKIEFTYFVLLKKKKVQLKHRLNPKKLAEHISMINFP